MDNHNDDVEPLSENKTNQKLYYLVSWVVNQTYGWHVVQPVNHSVNQLISWLDDWLNSC